MKRDFSGPGVCYTRRVKRGLYVFCLVLLAPSMTVAATHWQRGTNAADDAVQSEKRMAISVLREGQHLFVGTLSSETSLEGTFAGARGDTLILQLVDGSTVAIPAIQMDELWVKGRSVKGSAFIGAIAGMSAAAFVGIFAVATNSKSFTDGEDYIYTVAAYTLTGAAIGALVGTRKRWQKRYP